MPSKDEKRGTSASAESTSDGTAPPATFGQKSRRHCARFWWIYVLAFIAIVLVVVLPVIYVGYPNIAQNGINHATLDITDEAILNPSPDSVDVNLTSRFITSSSYHPNLDPFNASLYLQGSDHPFLNLHIPEIKGAKNGTVVQVDQTNVAIENEDAFAEYCQKTLASKEYTVYLTGQGGLKQGSLPYTTVNYNNSISMKGLNKFTGLKVTNFTLLNTTTNTTIAGANSHGHVLMPNPSILTLALGDVHILMSVNHTQIANATLPALVLRPGNHTYAMEATTNETAVALLLQNPAYRCGVLPVDIVGEKAVYGGQRLGYYSRALREVQGLRTVFNITDTLVEAGLGGAVGGSCI